MSLSLISCGNTQRNTVSIGAGAVYEHCGMAIYMIGFDRDPITFGCEGQVRDGLQEFSLHPYPFPHKYSKCTSSKSTFSGFHKWFLLFLRTIVLSNMPLLSATTRVQCWNVCVLCSDWPRKWRHMMCVIMFCQLEGQTITLESGYKSLWLKLVYENCSQWRFACDIHFVHERTHTHTRTHRRLGQTHGLSVMGF